MGAGVTKRAKTGRGNHVLGEWPCHLPFSAHSKCAACLYPKLRRRKRFPLCQSAQISLYLPGKRPHLPNALEVVLICSGKQQMAGSYMNGRRFFITLVIQKELLPEDNIKIIIMVVSK